MSAHRIDPAPPAGIGAPLPLTRRRVLAAACAGLAGTAPLLTLAAPSGGNGLAADRRIVFVVLRGGMDGLSAVPAPGDPAFAEARGSLGEFGSAALPLPGPFALHPALQQLHAMFHAGDALVVHATGLPYRERSHFDAQQVLESGGSRPYQLADGWLGRALAARGGAGLALGAAVPLVLRGGDAIDSWSPSALADPPADLLQRLQRLYAGDAALGPALQRARVLHGDAAAAMAPGAGVGGMAGSGAPAGSAASRAASLLATRAGEFLSQPRGPRAAVLDLSGWDTHASQARTLAGQLATLDAALAALRDALQAGGAWKQTVVVVATEFGRQVQINGTSGTDHGSGGAAFVLGGAVQGGRVLADWPGLAPAQRYENRDLRITTDLRAVLKGVLAQHWQMPAAVLDRQVFPGTAAMALPALLREDVAAARPAPGTA